MKNIVMFFYIDALNPSFLNSDIMPFLSSFANKHFYNVLENVFGYSFAIQSCMLSGKYPDETNHWMPYFYCPEESPLLFKTLNKLEEFFPLDRLQTLRYLTTRGSRQLFLKKGVKANNIPFCEIGKMALYPYYYMCELPFFFELRELLEEKSQTALTYIGPPKQKTNFHNVLFEHLRKSKHENEVIIIYHDTLDGLGHMFGPNSPQYLNHAKSLDSALSTTYRKLTNSLGKCLKFLVFSDHSQSELEFQIDLLSELSKKGLRLGVDYVCFVDATLALFWPEDDVAKEKIFGALDKIGQGVVIDEDRRKKYHMEFKDDRYGEIIYVLKPGRTFFPNFFSPFGAMKGLHGYLPEEDVQKAFLISNINFSHSFKHVKDFKDLVLNISSCKL
jgi:hypothetical protein